MKLHKLLMVEPKAPGEHVFSIVRLPRLGLPILGTLASRRGCDVRIVIEEMAPVSFDDVVAADLLCLSTITSTTPAAYRLADRARSAGVPVIIGGPHVTFLPEEALLHADWVLRGETERTFSLFLDMLEERLGPEQVPGLSYMRQGRAVHNQLDPDPLDLDSIPIPDFSLITASKGKHLFDRGVIPIQSSRGCPHNCSFCSVTPLFGSKMRFACPEHVAEELQRRRGQGRHVFFYDDNFCGTPERTKSLLDYLMTHNIFLPPWFAQVSVRAAKDLELLQLMERSGCHTVFVGFESIKADTLSMYHKRQSIEDIRLSIRRFQQHHIWVHGMFMFGSDADGLETIHSTRRFAIEEDIDTIQFLVLTPLPGTTLFEEMTKQNRFLAKDWSLFDTLHAVFQPALMSPNALMSETMKSMSQVYSPIRTLRLVFRWKLKRALFGMYAYRQTQRWQKENRNLFKAVKPDSKPVALIKGATNRIFEHLDQKLISRFRTAAKGSLSQLRGRYRRWLTGPESKTQAS